MSRAVVGTSVKRKEDRALLTGRGLYTDDLKLAGLLHAAVLRSPHAHARIRGIDTAAARELPGVVAVFTQADLGEAGREFPLVQPNPLLTPRMPRALASDVVNYVGEPVVFIVAEDRYVAEDAAELIDVDYEPLPAVVDAFDATQPGSPLVHDGVERNVGSTFTLTFGDVEQAFERAEVVLKQRLRMHRGGGHAMEARAVVAEYDARRETLTMWSATQAPHIIRRIVSEMLGVAEWQLRVIAPKDVGGGFGPKAICYPEEVLVPFAARALNRPVKWIEDRREHFLSAMQERDQYHDAEIAVGRDGKILGFRDVVVHDTGAYVPWGIVEPWITATTLPGPYKLPAFQVTMNVVYTHKVPVTPMRGAGRPQAVFAMERMVDQAAHALAVDPTEMRFRNFVQPEDMPFNMGLVYRDGAPVTYDSGNYPELLRQAMHLADYHGFRERQTQAREHGRYIGIGFGCYVEGTGLGPYEGALIQVDSRGRILLTTGAAPQGQSHDTTLAQIAAEQLGVSVDDVVVTTGDTGAIPYGVGTFASRVTVNAGNSVLIAAREVREKALSIAGQQLEADPSDLDLDDGQVFVRGAPQKSVSLGQVATIAAGDRPGFTLPAGVQPGLQASHYFSPSQAAYSSGVHAVVVEVDTRTGDIKILDYVVAHDCGRVVNPMLVDGQVQGGLAHGIGNCFYEELLFDDQGQLLTASFMDYLMPTANEVPKAKIAHIETPSPLNPLGVKGAGEGGTIPSGAAYAAAVEDALAPFGARVTEIPLSPERVRRLVKQGASSDGPGAAPMSPT